MTSLNGQLSGPSNTQFASFRIDARFDERLAIENEASVWVPSGRSAEVDASGRFKLALPDPEAITGTFALRVLAADGSIAAAKDFDSAALPAAIEIAVIPSSRTLGSGDPTAARRQKLTGLVIDSEGKTPAANLQVAVWARPLGPAPFQVVLVARTDRAGYFSGDYPRGTFDAAFGMVSGSAERQPIALLDAVLPNHVVFAIPVPARDASSDCACDATVPDAPDPMDLVRSPGSFASDLGSCVQLTTPNRALEEHSYYSVVRTTEPQIKGVTLESAPRVPPGLLLLAKQLAVDPAVGTDDESNVPVVRSRSFDVGISAEALGAAVRDADGFGEAKFTKMVRSASLEHIRELLGNIRKPVSGRATLNAKNPVDWDDTPTFYQATTIAHGHLLHFKQVWRANGYSLGDLLYSLPLAPCEKKQVVVVDWTRRDTGARAESTTTTETLVAGLAHDRDVNEVVGAVLGESMRGGSSSGNWGVAAGLGAAGSGSIGILDVGAVFGVSGGGGGASSTAWQDSSKDLSANALQGLRDRTAQAASAVRNQRTSVVQTVAAGETARVETSVVHNHNHCHSVTMEYFEVLRHLLVTQELVDVQECLFIPLLLSAFDAAKALRWRESLERALRKPALLTAFDAVDRFESGYRGSDLPLARYADETLASLWGELTITFFLRRPRDDFEADAERGAWDAAAWAPYGPFMWIDPHMFWTTVLAGLDPAARDAAFQRYAAPRIAEAFVHGLSFQLGLRDGGVVNANLHATLGGLYAPDAPLAVSLRAIGSPPAVARGDVLSFIIQSNAALGPDSKVIVNRGSVHYTTAHLDRTLIAGHAFDDDLTAGAPKQAWAPTPPDHQELRNPRAEDEEQRRLLLAHLNEHLEYYHKAIWWRMDANRRFMLLDGFEAPNADGRSVASVVENRLIGIVGNSLVMPVAHGFRLDPTYTVEATTESSLLKHYAPRMPSDPIRISLPTRGVFAEAVMGSCNACEKKDDSRFWRFEESPCGDEPTPIAQPSADSRRAESPSLAAAPLPQPIVAFQNVPVAPAPTGLGGALSVLGAPSPFANLTGLDRTQQNALASFQTAMQGAEYFGGQAAQLATATGQLRLAEKQQAAAHIDKTMQTIDQAQSAGNLDHAQVGAFKDTALRQLVGAQNASAPLDLQTIKQALDAKLIDETQAKDYASKALAQMVDRAPSTLMDNPVVADALRKAADAGRDIAVTSGPESVSVSGLVAPAVSATASPPFATSPLTLASLGLVADPALATKLAVVAKPLPSSGFAVVDLGTKRYASVNGATPGLGASICKLAIVTAAYRLRSAVRTFAAQSSATTAPALIKEIETAWTKVVGSAFPSFANPTFPRLAKIFSFATSGTSWAIDFLVTPPAKITAPMLTAATVPGAVFCDPVFQFRERLQFILEASNNEAATLCIEDLGFHYINGAMIAEGFDPKAGLMIWVGALFDAHRRPGVVPKVDTPLGFPPIAAGLLSVTPEALLMLLVALDQRKLVDSAASSDIITMMNKSGTFMQQAFGRASPPILNTFEFGKDGQGNATTDADVFRKPGGTRYGAVIVDVVGSAAFDKAAVQIDGIF